MLATHNSRRNHRGRVPDPGQRFQIFEARIICDELVTFFGSFDRYNKRSSAPRALMLEAYDGGPQQIDRIVRGYVYVPNWSLVVAGNIQGRRLQGMAGDLIDDGLFQRFMVTHTKPASPGADDDVPLVPHVGRDYRNLRHSGQSSTDTRVRRPPEARPRRRGRLCRPPQLHSPDRACRLTQLFPPSFVRARPSGQDSWRA